MTTSSIQEATDLSEFARAVTSFLDVHCTEEVVRASRTDGLDLPLWKRLARELGLTGLLVPESHGGAGAGWREMVVALEACGAALYPGPLLPTSVMAWAIGSADDKSARDQFLPGLSDGELKAAIALAGDGGPGSPPTSVTAHAGTLSGLVPHALQADVADLALVEAGGTDAGLYVVDLRQAEVRIEPYDCLDWTRRSAAVHLNVASGTFIGGRDAVETARSAATLAVAASQVGGAAEALRATVAYAGLRTQFDRPLGSFQAVKHLCVDVLLALESARAAVRYAARVIDQDPRVASTHVSIAKATASDAYVLASEVSAQVHGGIGFTWEHSVHLHLRRAKTDELLFGSATAHRAHLASTYGLTER